MTLQLIFVVSYEVCCMALGCYALGCGSVVGRNVFVECWGVESWKVVEDVTTAVVEDEYAEWGLGILHEIVPKGILVVEEGEVACEQKGRAM